MSIKYASHVTRHYRVHAIDALQVSREWNLSNALFSVMKYLQRAGLKTGEPKQKDMLKAVWYMVYETASASHAHEEARNIADDVADLILRACPSCSGPTSTVEEQGSSNCQCGSDCPSPGAYCSPGG